MALITSSGRDGDHGRENARARRVLDSSRQRALRHQEDVDRKHREERWDRPGVNCELPARPGGATDVGNADIDMAVDAVNAGSQIITSLGETDLSPAGAVQLLSDVLTARRRLDAAYLRTLAVVDHLDAAKASGLGAQNSRDLVKALGSLTPGRAKMDVAAARALHGERATTGTALVPAKPATTGPLEGLGGELADGEITAAHIDTAVRTLAKIPTEILDAAMDPASEVGEDGENSPREPQLVRERLAEYFMGKAPSNSPEDLTRLANHLVEVLDPDTDDHYDPDSFTRRSMTMSTDITGMVFGEYQLDPVAGARLRAILDPLSAPRPAQPDEDGNKLARDDRSAEIRRADGLMELVDAASAAFSRATPAGTAAPGETPGRQGDPAGALDDATDHETAEQTTNETANEMAQATSQENARAAVEALFALEKDAGGAVHAGRAARLRPGRRPARITVVTTAGRLAGTDRTPSHCDQTGNIGPGTLSRLVCEATFERLTLDAAGAVLDFGTGVRLATPAQRRAISARDKGCVFPGCNRPASWCDVHHVVWYSRGGPTSVINMCMLCPCHHSLIHTGRWHLTMIDGIPYARPAPGTIQVRVNGATATILGTQSGDGTWIRNSYFDELKETEHLARAITSPPSASG